MIDEKRIHSGLTHFIYLPISKHAVYTWDRTQDI